MMITKRGIDFEVVRDKWLSFGAVFLSSYTIEK